MRDTAFCVETTQPKNPFPMRCRIKQGGEPHRTSQVRKPLHQSRDALVRKFCKRGAPKRNDAVIEPLHREAVEIDEVAWHVNAYQLPFALLVIQVTQHGSFDDEIGVFDPLAALDQCLPWFQFHRVCDRVVQSTLLLFAEVMTQAAFKEQLCYHQPTFRETIRMARHICECELS